MSQYVVSLLSERPEDELRTIREKASAEVARLQVEIDQIDQALAKKAQQATRRSPRTSRRASASGGTRELVLNAVGAAGSGTVSPAQIIASLRGAGSSVSAGAIRNMIRRLVDDGEVVRIREGAYKLPSQNGSATAENNGDGTSLRTSPAATGEDEEREMVPMDGSRHGAG